MRETVIPVVTKEECGLHSADVVQRSSDARTCSEAAQSVLAELDVARRVGRADSYARGVS